MSDQPILFNNSMNTHAIPQNVNANQNINVSNLSVSSNPSNAPRSSISNNPHKPPVRPQIKSLLNNNKQQNYFFNLFKLLQNNKDIQPLHKEIASSDLKRDWIRAGPSQFNANKDKQEQFYELYRGKSNLMLTSQELGFKNVVMNQSKKLDDIWVRVIQVLVHELSSNKMIGVKILKKYVKESGIYKKFYLSEIGQHVLKPNENYIKLFFSSSNTNVVDEKSSEFLMIISRLTDLYFQEYTACITCLAQMVIHPKFHMFFQDKASEKSFLQNLWCTYKSLSNAIFIKKVPAPAYQQQKSELYDDLSKKCFERNSKLLISIIKLIYEALFKHYDEKKIQKAFVNYGCNFYKQFIKQLDSDIINFEKIEVCCNIRAENFTKMITELFLSLFPFEIYYVDKESIKIAEFNLSLREIQSQALTPIRLLLLADLHPTIIIKKFEQLIKTGLWNINNAHWKKWVGIFLKKCMPYFQKSYPKLLLRIVGVCKMIVSAECNQFWSVCKKQKPNQFYLFQIQEFINTSINDKIQSLTFSSVLPILTKLLGSFKYNYSTELIKLVGEQNIKQNIFNLIIDTLKLNADHEEERPKQPTLYTSNIQKQSIEQEMKFLCKLIYLQTKQLGELQRLLMDGSNQSVGMMITFMIIRCFQKITPERVQNLKSLRYLIQAIDAIFLDEHTRMLVPIALGASQTSKQSHKKQLRSIIDICVQPAQNSELSRQSIKLRKMLGVHLNHIVKLSDSLEQFFPTATKTEDEGAYKRLYDYIVGQDDPKINFFLNDPCLKSVPWFYYMLLILESDRLNSIDFQTIRLLLLKMRLKKEGSKQQVSLNLVGDMINNGKVVELIIKYLTPLIIKTRVQKKQKYVFGLSNQQFQLFMESSIAGEVMRVPSKYAHSVVDEKISAYSDLKYANKMYRFIKRKKQKEREKIELYGRLSGSVSIIETILKLNLEDQYPLLQKLTLNKFIIDGLLSNNAHMFDVKFTVKLQNPYGDRNDSDKQTMSTLLSTLISKRSQQMIERELQIKVSLLHTITSLIDFQFRMDVDKNNHPSQLMKLKGVYYIDIEGQQSVKINKKIQEKSRENILTEANRYRETIGISSVYKILEYLILLGHGHTVYYSLLYRNYPINRYFPEINSPSEFVNEFFEVSLRMLTRNDISMRHKQYIFEFFNVCLQQNHFSEYILSNLNKFKDSFIYIQKEMLQLTSPCTAITKVLLFFNLLLIKNSKEITIKFVMNCLVDPVKYGEQLIINCRLKLNQILLVPNYQNIYTNLLWCLTTQQLAACKASLLLYLGITSYFMCSEQQILASALCDLIIKQANIFLKIVPEILSTFGLDQLNLEIVHKYAQRVQLTDGTRCCFFPFNKQIMNTLIFNSPCSIVENYLYQPWQIQNKAKSKHLNERNLVLQGLRVNASAGLHFINESVVQYYYLLMISLFERGNNGYFFTNVAKKNQCDKYTSSVLNFMEKRAKNGLSVVQLLGKGENILKKCFTLCYVVIQQIWGNNESIDKNQWKVNSRDSGIMLLATLLKTIQNNLILQQRQSQEMTDCFKIMDKLLPYIQANNIKNFSLKVIVFLFQQLFRLSQKLLLKNLRNKFTMEIIDNYFEITNQLLQFLLYELGVEIKLSQYFEQYFDLLMLVMVILQKNIQNYELFQNSKQKLEIFLNNKYRYQFIQNIQKIILLYFPLLKNMNLNENIRGVIIQVFNKAFYLDTITKKYSKSTIITASINNFMTCLEKLTKDLSNSEVLTTIFISGFLAELGSYQGESFSRSIISIMKNGFLLFSTKLQKYNEISSLQGLVQMKNIFDLIVTIGSDQNWRNNQLAQMLNTFFALIQQKHLNFESVRVIASSQFEHQLSKRYVMTDKNQDYYGRSKTQGNKSIFELLVQLRLHQYLKFYLMFVTSSIKNSRVLFEFCEMTIIKGKLDELTWERIKFSLVSVINYYQKLTQLFEDSFLDKVILVNGHVCTDGGYLNGLGPISYYFQNYQSVEDFGCDVYQTVFLLYNTITMFLTAWKGYDWKTRIDWKGSRKDLLNVYLNLLNRYSLFTRICKSNDYEMKLNMIKLKVNESIELIEIMV